MPVVKAFCPGHISGYFKSCPHHNPLYSGSIGGGIVIDKGVTVRVTTSDSISISICERKNQDIIREIDSDSKILRTLLDYLQITAKIVTYSSLPIGCGYGLSAAALLATAHACNELYSLNLSPEQCAYYSHLSELDEKSGLGDVSANQKGGWVIRKTPGPRGEIVRNYETDQIFSLTFGPISTSLILSSPSRMDEISNAFPLKEPDSLKDLFKISREFAEKSGLITPQIRKVLTICDTNNIPASMTMLGEGVFALGKDAYTILKKYEQVHLLGIDQRGPRILEIIK